uniref:Uncharacterized protein n=1 Tax=Arion vulgaris TaxID=1028688 RepID=A0A0B7AHN8_9EUPU
MFLTNDGNSPQLELMKQIMTAWELLQKATKQLYAMMDVVIPLQSKRFSLTQTNKRYCKNII